MRHVVISQPKAGTYLAAKALENVGLRPMRWHLAPDHLDDYSTGTRAHQLAKPLDYRRPVPVEQAVASMPPGSFAVGHLPHDPRMRRALAGVRRVLLVRDLRPALVSLMVFEGLRRGDRTEPTPERAADWITRNGPAYLAQCGAVAAWRPRVRFEDLRAGDASGLADAFGLDRIAAERALRSALAAETLTKAPPRGEIWSDACERAFHAIGGPRVNASLGYGGAISRLRYALT